MSDSSMIERAGDAAYTAWIHSGRHEGDTWEQVARAVMAAMREPTRAMLDGARDWSRAKYGTPVGNDGAIGCWHAMIDAALE